MNWKNIIPWDWFKHEEAQKAEQNKMPSYSKNYVSQPVDHHPIHQLHDEIDRLFNEARQSFNLPSADSKLFESNNFLNGRFFKPNTNISTKDNQYFITLETPGMDEKDIEIELKDKILTIKGHKQEEKEQKDSHFYRSERYFGNFQRVLSLPSDAMTENIDASMKNGVLTIKLPRADVDESDIKKITINQ